MCYRSKIGDKSFYAVLVVPELLEVAVEEEVCAEETKEVAVTHSTLFTSKWSVFPNEGMVIRIHGWICTMYHHNVLSK
jgi:hypothetical protein